MDTLISREDPCPSLNSFPWCSNNAPTIYAFSAFFFFHRFYSVRCIFDHLSILLFPNQFLWHDIMISCFPIERRLVDLASTSRNILHFWWGNLFVIWCIDLSINMLLLWHMKIKEEADFVWKRFQLDLQEKRREKRTRRETKGNVTTYCISQ